MLQVGSLRHGCTMAPLPPRLCASSKFAAFPLPESVDQRSFEIACVWI
jgi:hypothetical protein